MALPTYHEAVLPPYSTDFNDSAHFLLKPELIDPVTRWPHRRWHRVTLQLQGTQILLHQQHSGLLFCRRPLSLQGAEVGLATDYRKRSLVVRIRVEGFQFLLAAASLMAAISWVDKLDAAIAVSADLNERKEPRYQTMVSSRMPTAEATSNDTHGISKLKQMWDNRRSSENYIWMNEQVGERGVPREPGLEQYLEIEAEILAQRFPITNDRSTIHCSCSTCFGTRYLNVPPTPSLYFSRVPQVDMHEPRTKITKGFTDDEPQHADRAVLARRRLFYAHRCAKTLGFRAAWKGCRYMRGQRWVKIEPQGAGRDYVLSLARYLVE